MSRPLGRPRARLLLRLGVLAGLLGGWVLLGMGWQATVAAGPPGTPQKVLSGAIVSPPPTVPMRFSHAAHSGSDFPCTLCHKGAPKSTQAADVLMPKMKTCVGCHDEAKIPPGHGLPGHRDTKACRTCHTRFNLKGFPEAMVWRAPRFRFNHRLHRAEGAKCLDCHKGVDRSTTKVGSLHLPKMRDCFRCHTGTRGLGGSRRRAGSKRASARCVTCHERQPGGRMRSVFPEGKLVPGPSLPSLSHGPTFRRHHKLAAQAHRGDCMACHQQATCLRCHGGVRRPASIHLGNWTLLHGRQARANRQKCQSCHTRQRFCTSCHSRVGLNPRSAKSPFGVPRIKRFHGANWASSTQRTRAANRHAVHARRNVSTCVSCHRESDCMRCHARRRVGGLGHSPHPPGFRHSRRCRVLLRKNRRSCLKCHGWSDPLMTLCR